MDLNFPTGPPAEWLPNWKSQLLTIGSFLSTSTFPLLFTPDFRLSCNVVAPKCLKLLFIYFYHVISPLPRIVFYLESRESDPREEIYGTTEDRLHIFFECLYCKIACWELEEKGTLCELMGDVSYFRRENSDYSSQDFASSALLLFYVLF